MLPKLKESEKLLQQLTTKTTITERLIKQSTEVLQYTQLRRITGHKDQIDEKITECIKLLSMIQELKLIEGENPEATMEWTTAQGEKHQNWDNSIEELDKRIKQLRKDEGQEKKQEEEDKWIEKQKKFHMELEGQKLKQLEAQQMKAKLPKLQLAKFDRTITDWVRFWEQFEKEIDKSKHYAAVTKFSYLQELYKTAKKLLRQKYGQTTEVIYAHGQQIATLPTIASATNLTLIHQFYRKLNVSINSLKTL